MAASVLDGEKLSEVSGNVRWSSMARAPMIIQSGSLAVYKLSDSFYIHARTAAKTGKVRLIMHLGYFSAYLCVALT